MNDWQTRAFNELEKAGESGLLTTTLVELVMPYLPVADAARRGHNKVVIDRRYAAEGEDKDWVDQTSDLKIDAAVRKGAQRIVLQWLYGQRQRGRIEKTGQVSLNAVGQPTAWLRLTDEGRKYIEG